MSSHRPARRRHQPSPLRRFIQPIPNRRFAMRPVHCMEPNRPRILSLPPDPRMKPIVFRKLLRRRRLPLAHILDAPGPIHPRHPPAQMRPVLLHHRKNLLAMPRLNKPQLRVDGDLFGEHESYSVFPSPGTPGEGRVRVFFHAPIKMPPPSAAQTPPTSAPPTPSLPSR